MLKKNGKKILQEQFNSSDQLLFDIIDSLPDATFVINREKKIIVWNKAIEHLTNVSKKKMLGQDAKACAKAFYGKKRPLLVDFAISYSPEAQKWYDYVDKRGSDLYAEIYFPLLYEGKGAYVWIKTSKLFNHKGQVIGVIETICDITERKILEKEARYLSIHDKLTGLYNRAFFEAEIKRLDSNRFMPLTIIMGDVNNLKLTNDIFGHHAGDKLLITIANILKSVCREEDIISRWGGDEFIILLPKTDEKNALEIINRIYEKSKTIDNNLLFPSIAIGTANKKDKSQNILKILAKAEAMMYNNKFIEENKVRTPFIEALKKMLWERDLETEDHLERVQNLTLKIGQNMDLTNDQMDELVLLSALHDIGKISIPDDVLLKPSHLSPKEWETMTKHVEVGYHIAQSHYALNPIAHAILFHHEHWNGSGYPKGLKGEEIPLFSRILAVADAFDVMTHICPYKQPKSKAEALQEIQRNAGIQFDPKVVHIFSKLVN